jgi:hypothetical protein
VWCGGDAHSGSGRFRTLLEHGRSVTVDVPAGCALLLPAFWYHQVTSHADEPETHDDDGAMPLNVAVNYWWSGGYAAATRHGILRDRLGACAQAAYENESR